MLRSWKVHKVKRLHDITYQLNVARRQMARTSYLYRCLSSRRVNLAGDPNKPSRNLTCPANIIWLLLGRFWPLGLEFGWPVKF